MKSSINKMIGFIAVTLLCTQSAFTQIQWTANGVKAANSDASNVNLSTVPDGQGGAFVVYENNLSPDINIYAQWLDGSGSPRWGSTGKAIYTGGLNQKNPAIVADGTGGAFVAWMDEDANRIKAQRLNSSGNPLWSSGGVYATNTTANQNLVKMVPDGATGVIMVFMDERNYVTRGVDLYAQRLDNQGNRMWGPSGKVVTEAVADQSQHQIIPDGAGGIVVVWKDYRDYATTNTDIYVQHLNAAGDRSWHVSGNYDGIPICTANKEQANPVIVSSDSKLGIAWADKRNDQYDIYAELLEGNGSKAWSTANGTPVCTATGNQTAPKICKDSYDGVIITWQDSRTGTDIYAQRMTVGGTASWTANGIVIMNASAWEGYPEIISDDTGGAVISWMDMRSTTFDIYAQHVNSSGNLTWNAAGFAICDATQNQLWHQMISDGSGGVITFWQDGRSSTSDIYAQKINENLSFTAPGAGALWAGSQANTIEWIFHTSQVGFDHFTIRASSSPGDGFPTVAATNVSPTALSKTWTPGSINSTTVQLKIEAYNAQNVKLSEFFSSTFTIDSDPPNTFNLTAPVNNTVTELQPAFQWQAATDNLTGLNHYELVIDGQTVKNNLQTTSYTLTSLEKLTSGPHSWYIRAVDGVNQKRQSATWNLTASEDNTPPNPFNLTGPADNSWTSSTSPTFSWQAATDDATGIDHYALYVDGGVNPIADNITSTSINSVTLAVGTHAWYVKAVDKAMNVRQSTQTWTIKIDNVIPDAFSLISPANNSWHATATPQFSWQASNDAGSGLAEYELYIDGSGTPWMDNIAPNVTQLTLSQDKALPEGSHIWRIEAKDVLGNTRSSSVNYTIGIDISAPDAFNLTSPANNAYVTTASPSLTWQAASDAVTSIAKYELYIDAALNRDGLTSTSATPASALGQGQHSWQVKAIDQVGNTTNSSLWNLIVDTQGPAAFNLISPSVAQTVYHNKPTFTWQTTADATSGFDHFALYVDDQKVADNLTAQQTQYTLTSPLQNGAHNWKVIACDKAGNTTQSGPQTFTTQVTAPVITSSNTAQGTEDTYFSYTGTATDAENDLLTYSFQNYPGWLSVNGATISGTPTEGITSASFTMKVTDGIFEVTQTVNVTITPVDDEPQITSPASADAIEDQNFTYTITATDPENDPITYSFSNYPGWMSVSNATIQGAPPEGVTSVTFTATATANGKTVHLTVTISVAGVDDPPQITSSGTGNATEDILYVYTATATDPENDPITFSFSNYPGWMTVSPSAIQGAPPEGVTTFTFTVTATANGKTNQKTVTVIVQAVDDDPQITSADMISATEDQAFLYTATATDAENDPITLTFSQYPAWMSVSGNTIQGTPLEGASSTSFTVTVTANGKTVQKIVTVNITAVDDPPQITSAATASGQEDALFTYTATATDIENDPITFSFSNQPAWMTVSNATIQGTPLNGITSFGFTVIATANGKTDLLDVTVTVQAVNDPPQITSADTVFVTEHQAFSYTVTAVDEEGDAINIDIQNLPAWMQRNGVTVSGTPENGTQDTSFTIVATAASMTDTKTVVVRVTAVNDPPQITSADTCYTTQNELFSYQVEMTDIDGPFVSVRFLLFPEWMKPMGRVIRGTVPANSQNSSFRIIVSDNHPANPLSDTLDVTVIVAQVNNPPAFTVSFPDPQFQSPDTIRWAIQLDDYVNDPDNPASELTWSYTLIDSQNISVTIDSGTHLANILAIHMWTDFRIVFTVTDPQQASASDTIKITILTTGIDRRSGPAPLTFSLSPNFPNPFNPETTIRYGIAKPCHVRLTILNIRGQIIANLIDEDQIPGVYDLRWNASDFASGIYFCSIETGTWHDLRRMILMK